MDIKDVKGLAKLADICRKKGIKQIKITKECVEFVLGDKEYPKPRLIKGSDPIDTETVNEEDALYWSAQGVQ